MYDELDLKRIGQYHGIDIQINQAVEEMAELMVALNKYRRLASQREDLTKAVDHVTEEIVDVEIMLSQIKRLLDIDPRKVEFYKELKIDRELARIKSKYGGGVM